VIFNNQRYVKLGETLKHGGLSKKLHM